MAKIPAKAATLDIEIEKSTDFIQSFYFTDENGGPKNLTNYTAQLIAKDATGNTILNWNSGSEISIDGINGIVTMSIGDTVTNLYTFDILTYCFFMTSGSPFIKNKYFVGEIILNGGC